MLAFPGRASWRHGYDRGCVPFCDSVKFVGVGGETFLPEPLKLALLLCNIRKDQLEIRLQCWWKCICMRSSSTMLKRILICESVC